MSVAAYSHPSPSSSLAGKTPPLRGHAQGTPLSLFRQLAHQIAQLARCEIPPEEFYLAFLKQLLPAFAAHRALLWEVPNGKTPTLVTEVQAPQAEEPPEKTSSSEAVSPAPEHAPVGPENVADWIGQAWHQELLAQATQSPLAAPPRCPASPGQLPEACGPEGAKRKNPTEWLLLFSPISTQGDQTLVVELVVPGQASLVAPRQLRLLAQMAELAASYFRSRRVQQLQAELQFWHQLEEFSRQVHARLNTRWTAYSIVNEGRRLLGCDRLSLLVAEGPRCRLVAISGSSEFDPRSPALRLLSQLTAAVLASKESFFYTGTLEDLAPQIQPLLDSYVDQTHTKAMAIVPLWPSEELCPSAAEDPKEEAGRVWPAGVASPEKCQPIGALVLEQFEAAEISAEMRCRLEAVACHGQTALSHCLQYEGIFLRPVWEALGRQSWWVWVRTWPKLAWMAAAALVGSAVLFLTPARLEIEATGTLEPVVRQEVFAGIDGRVEKVLVRHGDRVQGPEPGSGGPGTLLCVLRNYELEEEFARLSGEQASLQERLAGLNRALLERHLSPLEADRLSAEQAAVRQRLQSLERQLAVCQRKQEQLYIYSPIDGQVITWDVAGLLLHRPVRRGDRLLRIAQTEGPWQLELHVPEDRIGYLLQAKQKTQSPLPVRFLLATDPTRSYQGQLVALDATAQERAGEGRCVLAKVQIEASQITPLLPGTQVRARIDCGRCSLAYRWFHDLVAWFRRICF